MSEDSHREFLLSALRVASLRAKLFDNEMTTIGIALRDYMITPAQALKWIRDAGADIGMVPDEIANGCDADG